MSRVVSNTHPGLLVPGAIQLLLRWVLHWWQISGSTKREPFLSIYTLMLGNRACI